MYEIVVGLEEALIGLAVVALFAAAWVYQLRSGVPFRPVTTVLGSAVCLGLFFLVESGSWLGWNATAPLDLLFLVLAGIAAAAYSYDIARVVRFPDGRTGYRTEGAVPVAWFFLLILAVAAEVVFLGQVTVLGEVAVVGIPNPAPGLGSMISVPGADVLAFVDGLFALSTGLVLGQTAGTHARLARYHWNLRTPPPSARAGG